MKVTVHSSPEAFLAAAGAWLEREEALNGLILGLAARLAGASEPPEVPAVLMTASGPDGLAAACLQTSPRRPLILYAPGIGSGGHDQAHAALAALADALQDAGHEVVQCVGPSPAALVFCETWTERTGRPYKLLMGQRIYELREVIPPKGVPGSARYAERDDLDLLADWRRRYAIDIGEQGHPTESREMIFDKWVNTRQTMLWQDGGEPVSMAITTRRTRRGVAIGGVYTPPKHRGQGFASACVAELSRRLLDGGREFCCLYTDASNATSNSIYRKIGYNLVAESSHYAFI